MIRGGYCFGERRTISGLGLLTEELAFSIGTPSARSAEISDLGNGLVRLAPNAAEITARIDGDRVGAMWILEKRANGLGLSGVSMQPAGLGRIRAIVPGLFDPNQLINLLHMTARLEFRLVDTSIDACEAANGSVRPDSEVFFHEDGKGPVLVRKQPVVGPGDMIDAVVALAPVTDRPTVVFRLAPAAGHRFAQTTQENVGGSFAVVLDQRIIAIARIAEPLGGCVQLSDAFGLNEADRLSVLLRAAIFPARLVIVEQQVVAAPVK